MSWTSSASTAVGETGAGRTPANANAPDEDIDDALLTESVSKLLSETSGNFDRLTADILVGHHNPSVSAASSSGLNATAGGAHGHHSATMQEGIDLVDALDTLVQRFNRESIVNSHGGGAGGGAPFVNDGGHSNEFLLPVDIVFMDHNYCQPVIQSALPIIDPIAVSESIGDAVEMETPATRASFMASIGQTVGQASPLPVQVSPLAPMMVSTDLMSTTTSTTVSCASSPNSNSSFGVNTSSNNSAVSATVRSAAAAIATSKVAAASRRSQRQIDKIEKSVLEKIKAENAEMLKREKESMESPTKPLKAESLTSDDTKDADESELVIDFDNKSKKSSAEKRSPAGSGGKKRLRKSANKSQTDVPSNKKTRIEISDESISAKEDMTKKVVIVDENRTPETNAEPTPTPPVKHESSELDDVIAALNAGVNSSTADDENNANNGDSKTPASGRSQRTRRKPKRWDDDEVEVDFSGQLGILAQEPQPSVERKISESRQNNKSAKSRTSSSGEGEAEAEAEDEHEHEDDDDEDSGSDFGSEDDPDKLWCVCRQPHDDRFMIGCDSCEEWFHGNCVNVTKQQGRLMEKAGQEWLCPNCKKGISEGVSREELKKIADEKRTKLEAEERIRAQTKRAAKEKFLKKERSREAAKKRESLTDSDGRARRDSSEKRPKLSPKRGSHLPIKKRESSIKLEEEKEKLKKLIKSSKKEFKKKRELMGGKPGKDRHREGKNSLSPITHQNIELQSISRVVPVVRKPEAKKKHKDAIDPSVQDLFKAEPIRKTPSTPTTPVTPTFGTAPPFRNRSEPRRTSTSLSVTERLCPSVGCGKMVKSETTVYCSAECVDTHVTETLKLLRIARKEKGDIGGKSRELERRVVVVEKSSGRLLSGKDGILERDVLEFIRSNPTFEIFKTSNMKDKKKEEIKGEKQASPAVAPVSAKSVSPRKDERRMSASSKNSGRNDNEGADAIRANVRSSLKETLISRCKEVNDIVIQTEEIRKIAVKIEDELYKLFNRDTSAKYRNKYRSLIFNLKDPKNQGLFRKVINGKISPERLVQMSAEELASSELAKWREREKITMLEMIKRDAADKVNQVIVKKTHKGEELIENTLAGDTTNEPKIGDGKVSSSPSSALAPNSGVSTLLEDLMGSSTVDTTSQHRTHLFSNNCKICTKQQLPDDNTTTGGSSATAKTHQDVVARKSSALSHSTSTGSHSRDERSRPTPKRVRVELEDTNKLLQEAAKLSSTTPTLTTPLSSLSSSSTSSAQTKLSSSAADDDDSAEAPSSTLCLSSPEAPSSSSSSRPLWKGTVFMQDVAKFAATAIKVSGGVSEFLSQDVAEQITVCGRIAPEQVLDYVKKLKYSSRTEIGIVKFVSSRDERVGYDAFFNYLDSRGRYGVVGSTGKLLKDFYILPLSKSGDVPDVLLPFDGPGLDKKSLRPNLLLGILVRSKKPIALQIPIPSSSSSSSSSATSTSKSKLSSAVNSDRSYTPPPKHSSQSSSPEDKDSSGDVSYTPPRTSSSISSKTKSGKSAKKPLPTAHNDDDEPYDPEEAEMSNSNPPASLSAPLSLADTTQEIMEQIANSSNPTEFESVMAAISANTGSSNHYDMQRRLLDLLTAKVEEQKKQVEEQRRQVFNPSSSTAISISSQSIPGLDGQFGTSTSEGTSLARVAIPELQEILASVKRKSREIDLQQAQLKAVAASGFRLDDPIVKNFSQSDDTLSKSLDSRDHSPDTEPMDLDDDVTPAKSTIIELNAPPAIAGDAASAMPSSSTPSSLSSSVATAAATATPTVTDPRLRSKKQTPLPSLADETGGAPEVATMTSDELMQKAREQMAALAQMEITRSDDIPVTPLPLPPPLSTTPVAVGVSSQSSSTSTSNAGKIKIEWKKKK